MNKKLLIAVAVLVVVVAAVAVALAQAPERRICMRLGEVCGAQGSYQDYDACVTQVEQIEKTFGEEPVEQAAECIDEVDTCPAAAGCIAGTGMSVMHQAMGEFMKGFTLSQKKRN